MQVGETNTKICGRAGYCWGRGFNPIQTFRRDLPWTSKLSAQGTEDVSINYYLLLLRSSLWILIPYMSWFVHAEGRRWFQEYFQERCWYLLSSQFRLPNIQIRMIACFRVVVWEKGVLISVFASVLEMLLKLCKIQPTDFSWVKN